MKISNKALVAIATVTASAQALAHPGHDHSANTAVLSHVALYGSIAAVAVIAFVGYKFFKNSK